jgi:signal transduction histidine kinase
MHQGPKPAKSKAQAKPPAVRKSPKNDDARVHDLEKRLEEALKGKAEALEQQTATAEVLKVISRSTFDLQPVLDTLIENAARLCGAPRGAIFRRDGDLYHGVAFYNASPELVDFVRRHPVTPGRYSITARTALEQRTIHVADIQADAEYGYVRDVDPVRTELGVPMFRGDDILGIIILWKFEVQPFSDKQIELVETFADQAVIAIENVRLFKELETRNHDLTEALDQQTATSEILRVISGAQREVQPVFDTIVQSAARLCSAAIAAVFRTDGRTVYHPANYGDAPEALAAVRSRYPRPLDMATIPGIAILTRSVVHFSDVEESPVPEHVQQVGRLLGFRGVVGVPMLREGEAVGALLVARREPGSFSDAEIELLRTFADQAVIAIENVRLFTELQARTADLSRSVEQLTALGDVGRAVSSTLELDAILQTIATRANQLAGADACAVFEYEEATEAFNLRASNNLDEDVVALARQTPTRKGEGVQGRMAVTREPVQVPDIAQEDAYRGPLRDVLLRTGTRAVLAIPMLCENRLIGGLTVNKRMPGEFRPEVIELLKTFATQSALAIHNAWLFREIEEKSRQLEVASQHKSEFLANMSHELRTPLNAIIGFSEVLTDRMFGELNEKQEEYLKDIYASGTHLLSLINDILDLSKIEAGRMELELTDFHLPTAIENALMLVREKAGRRSLSVQTNIDAQVGAIQADERKVRQVVLNLLSNAIKFTPEGGRIDVGAVPKDGFVEVSVSDTGIGIAPEDQERVFEEFRQVGTAAKKVEGTGLGLTLCRKFVELHGGKIWVKSQIGHGATFTLTLPIHHGG